MAARRRQRREAWMVRCGQPIPAVLSRRSPPTAVIPQIPRALSSGTASGGRLPRETGNPRSETVNVMRENYGDIVARRDGHVALLEINRPPNNHVSIELMRSLADALVDIDKERELRAGVLMSAGKNFCAGADFSQSTSGIGGGGDELYAEAVRIYAARKPIVAAVQGAAVGAGLGLALAADF